MRVGALPPGLASVAPVVLQILVNDSLPCTARRLQQEAFIDSGDNAFIRSMIGSIIKNDQCRVIKIPFLSDVVTKSITELEKPIKICSVRVVFWYSFQNP